MFGIEEVSFENHVVATVFRSSIPVTNDVQFLTPTNNPFQIGIHERKGKTHLKPHSHRLEKPLVINEIQELLYLVSGKIQITLYSNENEVIEKKVLEPGDSILLMHGGHGVDFLEDSRVFEIKQGPYPGAANAKIFVNET